MGNGNGNDTVKVRECEAWRDGLGKEMKGVKAAMLRNEEKLDGIHTTLTTFVERFDNVEKSKQRGWSRGHVLIALAMSIISLGMLTVTIMNWVWK